MIRKTSVFLDTSALFSGIWSSTGGSRLIFKLGEAGAIQIYVSSQVLSELEAVLHKKSPNSLGYLAILLEESQIEVTPAPGEEIVRRCKQLISHAGDAYILASAWSSAADQSSRGDFFVTLDRKHFLENTKLTKVIPFQIGTPGDFLAWFRRQTTNQDTS
jgi:predicted nucleic acid-binding protein